mgnify:CR=1 FL=1
MSLVIGTKQKMITEGFVMHNRDQFDQEMRRFEEREELSGPMTGAGGNFMNKQKIVKYAFMALLGFEAMLCWNWLIQPLMPVITNIINNKGALSLSAGMPTDISHPLGSFSIGGMNAQSAMSLYVDSLFRLGLFSAMFGLTFKAYSVIRRFMR